MKWESKAKGKSEKAKNIIKGKSGHEFQLSKNESHAN